jgi:putative MATE family efflux protein
MTAITVSASPAAPNPLLSGAVLPTLLRMSLPNVAAMLAMALVAIGETAYVGSFGTPALAGFALVFPLVMLQQMMSAGAMGGGVSSAIARAIGAGDDRRAAALALHAAIIGTLSGVAFTIVMIGWGSDIFQLLGGSGDALDQALAYANVAFLGSIGVWLTNTLASVIRGSGNMQVPSLTLLLVNGAQVVLGGALGLGLGILPRLGMPGVALGQVLAYAGGTVFLLWYVAAGRSRVRLALRGISIDRAMFADILRVGALSCISPVQTVLTSLIATRIVATGGAAALAGYGIGSRLEFLLVPITFGIGVATVPLVGMAIGSGDIARARRVAWTGGLLSMLVTGIIGAIVTIVPDLWAGLFTSDPAVLAVSRTYFQWVGPCYGLFGLGLCLYFASQGAGRVLGPVLTGTLRLLIVGIGGFWLANEGAGTSALFAVIAAGMVVYGSSTAAAVAASRWGEKAR